mmetsp:Transcript_67514/g.166781  ORF Transcript_67514/g.166781 Transcript_67514/m.166781 type:complete len:1140 (+) Transcript_67514:85-3504(+)
MVSLWSSRYSLLCVFCLHLHLSAPVPTPRRLPEAWSVRKLQEFAWYLDAEGFVGMNWSVFEAPEFSDERSLPPKGRGATFASAFRLFEQNSGRTVVELGTTRSFVGGHYDGCNGGCFDGGCSKDEVDRLWRPHDPSFWDWGAGVFGRMAATCLRHVEGVEQYQVDINHAHLMRALHINADMDHVQFVHGSSLDFLADFTEQIDLLYLDTGDISPIEESALLQRREAEIIVERDLIRAGGLVLIDDVLHPVPIALSQTSSDARLKGQPVSKLGKAKYSIPILLDNGFEIVEDEFQVLLRKKDAKPDETLCLRVNSPRNGSIVVDPQGGAAAWLDFRFSCLQRHRRLSVHLDGALVLTMENAHGGSQTSTSPQPAAASLSECKGFLCPLCFDGARALTCTGWLHPDRRTLGLHTLTFHMHTAEEHAGEQSPSAARADEEWRFVWEMVPPPADDLCTVMRDCGEGEDNNPHNALHGAPSDLASAHRQGHDEHRITPSEHPGDESTPPAPGSRACTETASMSMSDMWLDLLSLAGRRHGHTLELSMSTDRTRTLVQTCAHVTSLFVGGSSGQRERLQEWEDVYGALQSQVPRHKWTPLRAAAWSDAAPDSEHLAKLYLATLLSSIRVDTIIIPCFSDPFLASVCTQAALEALTHGPEALVAVHVAENDSGISTLLSMQPDAVLVCKSTSAGCSHLPSGARSTEESIGRRRDSDEACESMASLLLVWSQDSSVRQAFLKPVHLGMGTDHFAAAASGQDSIPTSATGVGAPRVLHLGFHHGVKRDLEAVGAELGIEINFEMYPSGTPSECSHNIDKTRSLQLWQEHGQRWMQYDIIVTSDTAATSRPLQEYGRWDSKRLIVWVCNRFDYRSEGVDGGIQCKDSFPEASYYQLFRDSCDGKLGPNVRVVPYTKYEAIHAAKKGVNMFHEVVKPSGLTAHSMHSSSKYAQAEMSELFFLPPRGNDRFMSYQCVHLSIPCYRGDGRQPRLSGAEQGIVSYGHPKDLSVFKAVIHIPYTVSTVALFDWLQAGLVVMIPTARFFLELSGSCYAWGDWLCKKTQAEQFTEPVWFGQIDLWLASTEDLEDGEWWAPENKDFFMFFDSWEELRSLTERSDYSFHQQRVRERIREHTIKVLGQWRSLFGFSESV